MNVLAIDSVDSTNAEAWRLLAAGAIAGPTVLRAREQTAGRGTAGRSWVSPRDAGLYLTIVEPNLAGTRPLTTLYTLTAGIATAETVRHFTGLDVRLKPINDVYVGAAKLGGILTEAVVEDGRLQTLITGIGLNTHRAVRRLPAGSPPATALEELMLPRDFGALNLDAIAVELVAAIQAWHRRATQAAPPQIIAAYARYQMEGTELPPL